MEAGQEVGSRRYTKREAPPSRARSGWLAVALVYSFDRDDRVDGEEKTHESPATGPRGSERARARSLIKIVARPSSFSLLALYSIARAPLLFSFHLAPPKNHFTHAKNRVRGTDKRTERRDI